MFEKLDLTENGTLLDEGGVALLGIAVTILALFKAPIRPGSGGMLRQELANNGYTPRGGIGL